jgi:hypothetical protein
MAYERPDELYRSDRVGDAPRATDEFRPAERRSSGGRFAMYAVALAIILGALFYGLNNSAIGPSPTTPTATRQVTPDQNVADQMKPPVAPGVRDVTPSNRQPGTTTGAAPSQPAPPASNNAGANEGTTR